MAVYYSMLESASDADLLYDWMHPDAKSVVPRETVVGWYATEFFPNGPQPIEVEKVRFVDWTWPVTGMTYGSVAEVTYRQRFADGTEARDVIRLVRDGDAWRWFFGRDAQWVEQQIARFGGTAMAPDLAGLLPPVTDPPGGLPPLEEGVGDAGEIAASFPNPTATAALLDRWGWTESAYRTFAGDGIGPGNATRIEVSIHRFASEVDAAEAAAHFGEGRAEVTGLSVAREAQPETVDIAVVGATGAGLEASLYSTLGPLVVRVTAVVPDGNPVAAAATIMDGVRGRFARHSSQSSGEDELVPEPDILPVCVIPTHTDYPAPELRTLTREHAISDEIRFAQIVPVDSTTGECVDPAMLLVALDRNPASYLDAESIQIWFPAFTCWRKHEGRWAGPGWDPRFAPVPVVEIPPDPTTGGCPGSQLPPTLGRWPTFAAASSAVYYSMLTTSSEVDLLYDWMHPDARALIPREAVAQWYTANVIPKGPQPIRVEKVEFEDWTWPVTGTTYGSAAKVTYSQQFADGTEVRDSMHLVRDGDAWRWFFGQDRAWVETQIEEYAPGWQSPTASALVLPATSDAPTPDLARTIDEVAAQFSDADEAVDRLLDLGWVETSARSVSFENATRDPSATIDVVVHRFWTSAGAVRALDAFVADRATLDGLQEIESRYLGFGERALVGASPGDYRVLLYAQRGPFVVEVVARGTDVPTTEFRARDQLGSILANDDMP